MKTKNEKSVITGKALLTTKNYKVSIDKAIGESFSCHSFVSYVKALLPNGMSITIAENTTGKGHTVKIFKGTECMHRFFFPSQKIKYKGIGIGKPELTSMLKALPITFDSLHAVRQGQKEYWYSEEYSTFAEYLNTLYKAE